MMVCKSTTTVPGTPAITCRDIQTNDLSVEQHFFFFSFVVKQSTNLHTARAIYMLMYSNAADHSAGVESKQRVM